MRVSVEIRRESERHVITTGSVTFRLGKFTETGDHANCQLSNVTVTYRHECQMLLKFIRVGGY